MFSAFSKALAQVSDPRIRRIIWVSLGLTIVTYAALVGLSSWGLTYLQLLPGGWDTAADVFGVFLVFIIAMLLFPVVVSSFIGLFLETVADAVEAKYYPDLGPARAPPVLEVLWTTISFTGVAVILNLLILPLYFFPIVGQIAFYAINGYLLSREYFELVAMRRVDRAQVQALRKVYMMRLWVAGAVTTFLLTIPVINIIAAVLGVAAMVHIAHALAGEHFRRGGQ